MPDFDFRKHSGGQLPHDEALADGIDAHWLAAREAVAVCGGQTGNLIAEALCHALILNCALHRHCPPAVLALMLVKLCEPVPGHDVQHQAEMKKHVLAEIRSVLAEIRSVLAAIDRGEL
jgi:hypothetical protein